MRKRWRGMMAGISLAVCLVVLVATVRSFLVADSFTWTNSTAEPLPPEFEGRGNLVGRIEARRIELYRGRMRLGRQMSRTVLSRWDEKYEREFVNQPQWLVRHPSPRDVETSWRMDGFWGRLGFEHGWPSSTPMRYSRYVTFPLWPIVIVTAIPPAAWLRRTLRLRRRRRGGLCLACGYDLRGTDVGGRCPECGTGAAAATIREPTKEPAHVH